MEGRERTFAGVRPIVYCLIPRELAPRLHEFLRRHFHDDRTVEVIVERRAGERRAGGDRRERATASSPVGRVVKTGAGELRGETAARGHRRIRSLAGRRVVERRAPTVVLDAPELPRRARPFAERLAFVERLEPSDQHAEDVDTARLITRIQTGERDAFALLYMRYFDRVYTYLRLILRDPTATEDAAQQVFVQALGALPDYEQRGTPFRAWLFIVARNHAINELRHRQRLDLLDPVALDGLREGSGGREPDDYGLAGEVLDWISDRELMMFIERLPLAQRQVLVLRYMLGMTNQEVARVLGRSHSDVRVLHHRALSFLRTRLAGVGRGPKEGQRIRMRRSPRHAPVLRHRRFALML
jgi:RNA polymerase sigma-70 factor (ECF subfamily)